MQSRKWVPAGLLASWWCGSAIEADAGHAYLGKWVSIEGMMMTTFDDREKAQEAKFVREEEMAFRVTARRNKLLGQWAASRMGLTPEETDSYAKSVVQADFEEVGDEDVIRKLLGDLTGAQVETSDEEIRQALADMTVEARRQLMESM
jgi:hypothetical protein